MSEIKPLPESVEKKLNETCEKLFEKEYSTQRCYAEFYKSGFKAAWAMRDDEHFKAYDKLDDVNIRLNEEISTLKAECEGLKKTNDALESLEGLNAIKIDSLKSEITSLTEANEKLKLRLRAIDVNNSIMPNSGVSAQLIGVQLDEAQSENSALIEIVSKLQVANQDFRTALSKMILSSNGLSMYFRVPSDMRIDTNKLKERLEKLYIRQCEAEDILQKHDSVGKGGDK